MLTKLENLSKAIEDAQKNFDGVKTELDSLEMSRLQDIINVAKKGLKFEKIYSEKIASKHSTDYQYFEDIKGILIDQIEIKDKQGQYGRTTNYRELFLLSDCSFKVFYYTEDISYWQDESSTYSREISKYQELNQFNFDNITESIIKALEKRLIDLGDRTKEQKKRLEKLEALKVK